MVGCEVNTAFSFSWNACNAVAAARLPNSRNQHTAFTAQHVNDCRIEKFASIVDYELMMVDASLVPQDEMYAGIRVVTKRGRKI